MAHSFMQNISIKNASEWASQPVAARTFHTPRDTEYRNTSKGVGESKVKPKALCHDT